MNPPAEGQEKNVLLILDKPQGKVNAVKGIDNRGIFYQAKVGMVVPKLHGVQMDEKSLQRPYNWHEFSKQEQR